MAWEYVATGMSSLTVALILLGFNRQAKSEDRTEKRLEGIDDQISENRETVIQIFKEGQAEMKAHFHEVCGLKQSKCHDDVAKDIAQNKCNIEKLRVEKKEMWQDHMKKCHRNGCPE